MIWVHHRCYLMLRVFYEFSSPSVLEDIQHMVLSRGNSSRWVRNFFLTFFFHKCSVLIFSSWMLRAIPDTADVMSQRNGSSKL